MTQLLRIATAGSVDDGKSTLIGRLLYDSKAIFEDQLERGGEDQPARAARTCPTSRCSPTACAPSASRASPSTSPTATSPRPKRKFIIADTPGHIQYTRNMVTGASTADVALILIDARNGVLEQSRRHAFLATLLGIPHLVVCINKMDLVDYSQERFEEIRDEFRGFATKLEVTDLVLHPDVGARPATTSSSAAQAMPWYEGTSLLHHLEEVHVASDRNLIDVRFPVQYVIRPHQSTTPSCTTSAATPARSPAA